MGAPFGDGPSRPAELRLFHAAAAKTGGVCGIYGIAGRLRDGDDDVLRAMDARLFHRGPDEGGTRRSPLGLFGMRRLSIIDLTSGHQPIANEDGSVWVTFNGEVYNHTELRRELQGLGHRFQTRSDTETIVHAYEAYGDAFVEHLRGMFAIAIWDERQGRIVLARDRIGKKPLYVAHRNGRLVYGSELKAILADPHTGRTLDRRAVWHYLTLKHVPAPLSIFQGVATLPAGHRAVFSKGQLVVESWWRPRFTGEGRLSEDEAADELLQRLDDAVRVRVDASDVPVGAFLSGGIDSSLVVALMARHAPKPLKTFSMGYAESVAHKNDIGFARDVAAEFGTEHHELTVRADDVVCALPRIVEAFDEPFGGTISPYLLAALIARHVKVALSGDGADELFGSYAAHRMAAVVAGLRDGGSDYGSFASNRALADVAAGEADGVWRTRFAAFTDAEKPNLLAPDFGSFEPTSDLIAAQYAVATPNDLVNATLEVECGSFLPDQVLTYVDRLSMAHALEVRVPFLDQEVVRFAGSLPGRLKVRPDATKSVLKNVARRVLPARIVDRPKEGFVLPMDTWLDRELRPLARELFSPGALRHGLFRASAIDELWSERDSGARDNTYRLWTLMMFQLWYSTYLERGRFDCSDIATREVA